VGLTSRLADTLHDLVQPGAVVRRGNSEQAVASFAEAHDWLMDESRKGRSFHRFKGLGEMNPLQLRETTIAPETRRLVQLTIDLDDDTHKVMDMLLARKRAGDRRSWLESKGDLAEA
jgi:DNA gyrase/topoisomerase IV subunit B